MNLGCITILYSYYLRCIKLTCVYVQNFNIIKTSNKHFIFIYLNITLKLLFANSDARVISCGKKIFVKAKIASYSFYMFDRVCLVLYK